MGLKDLVQAKRSKAKKATIRKATIRKATIRKATVRKATVRKAKAVEDLRKQVVVGPPKLTRFERARIIGARALQISMGAPVLVTPPRNVVSPIDAALLELEAKVLPMTLRRTLPDGTYQDIPVKWLVQTSQ